MKEKYKWDLFPFDKKTIPVVCEGWKLIGKKWYREYYTSEGVIRVQSVVYKVK
jgi:hypothetical protein